MAWNEPGNKDPWGRNKNNSGLDGVIKDFKKTVDDLFGGIVGRNNTPQGEFTDEALRGF